MAVDAATAQAAVEQSAGQRQRDFLFGSRALDFWLLGGLSVAVWLPLYFFLERGTLRDLTGTSVPAIAFLLAYWVNYPHFMASYKLAYGQGTTFVRGNWFQLIAVPMVFLLAIVAAWLAWEVDVSNSGLIQGVNGLLAALGLETRFGRYPNLGREILGQMVVFMYFTVGWHYAKQAFGCMMVYARLDGYQLTGFERNLVRYALLSTWWVTFVYINIGSTSYPFYNLDIYRLNLPYWWLQAGYVVAGGLFAALLVMVVRKYRLHRQLPSWNFVIPMLALLVWHIPLLRDPQYFYLLGFFHSLQYFPFVAKVEHSRYVRRGRRWPYWRLALFFGLMVTLGFLAFDWVPHQLDRGGETWASLGVSFFIISFIAFINIHHYFIDNVLWRFKNREVRELLFH